MKVMTDVLMDTGPLSGPDSVRGIGVYVRELSERLKGVEIGDINNTDLTKYKLVHMTRFSPFKLSVPKKPRGAKFILTIYDLIPLIYPKNYPPGIKAKFIWELNKLHIRNNVDGIITISETSKKDICRFLDISPKKVSVTYLAPRTVFKKIQKGNWQKEIYSKYKLPKKFALYTGDINFNKNIPGLVKGCKLAGIPLVVAGKHAVTIKSEELGHPELSHLKEVDWSGVIRLGFVDDKDLVKIYNMASVYVQASFYEGFGLPLLEAAVCGVPIAAARNQCHVEILGSNYRYFDPYNIVEIAEAVKNPNIINKLPRDYSWAETAKKTQSIYDKILS